MLALFGVSPNVDSTCPHTGLDFSCIFSTFFRLTSDFDNFGFFQAPGSNPQGSNPTNERVEKSGWISDNTGKRWFWNTGTQAEDQVADCPDGMAVTHLECSGKCCDNLRIHGAKPLQWVVDMTEDPVVTTWFSEEQRRMDCQEGKVVVGVECQASKGKWCLRRCGLHCDNKRLRCRSIRPEMAGSAVLGVLGALQMPESTQAAPPASSPWWSGASDLTSGAWNLFSSTGISGAQCRLQPCFVCTVVGCSLLNLLTLDA